jgi:D-3-phosphoglycerate dehydrogenase / 2-oxoglutarate reductase
VDLHSASELNRLLAGLVPEKAVFRVDHFLAMTTVENVLGTRLANRVLEPIWNSAHVSDIEIIWEESLALEGRAGYYDGVGALKDMLQNHLLQLLCLVAMEPPVTLGERDLRDRKVDVLRSIRPITDADVAARTRRARYGAGTSRGRAVPAYADEQGVDPEHRTETFAEIELELENWRWPGTKFRLRTGKALGRDRKEVVVHFRPVPHLPFGHGGEARPNLLRFGLEPEPEGLFLELTGTGSVVQGPGALAGVPGRLGRARSVSDRCPLMIDGPEQTVVITDFDSRDVDIERPIIEAAGLRLIAAQCATEDEVIDAARDADAIIAQRASVGARAIGALTRCRVIARYGTSVDTVDVDAATRRGILVTNVPDDWRENEVADHALALLLAVARKICIYDRATRRGTWQWRTGNPVYRLRGRVVGLLSFGSVAQAITDRASGFGLRVIAHDPNRPGGDITVQGATPVSFDELIEQSDYLVIQAPLTEETHHLIGEQELRRMKRTAFLINTARGPIVSDAALYRALSEGWIAGAGLDDIEEEPAKRRNWKPVNALFTLPNAVITPHAASYSEEAILAVRDFAAREVVRVLTGQPPISPVNAEELASARARGGAREDLVQ